VTVRSNGWRWTSWDAPSDVEGLSRIELALQLNGLTYRQIAERVGDVSKSAVSKKFRSLGVKKGEPIKPELNTASVWEPALEKPEFDWRKWTAHMKERQKLEKKAEPYENNIVINIKADAPFAVMNTADWHGGSLATDYDSWQRDMELVINTPNLYMGICGDTIDNFVSFYNKYSVFRQAIPPERQHDWAQSVFYDLYMAEKILYFTWDHHGGEFDEKLIGYSVMKKLMTQLAKLTDKRPIHWLDGKGIVTLRVNEDIEYKILATHRGRFNSYLNPTHSHAQEHRMYFPDADIVVMGHIHRPEITQGVRYGRRVIFIRIGAYKTGPEDVYSSRYFEQGIIGAPTVVFHHDEKRMVAFHDARDALRYMGKPVKRRGKK
jgi:UDP-2,3-diacylglucosamine pyrophosphatase LpxH